MRVGRLVATVAGAAAAGLTIAVLGAGPAAAAQPGGLGVAVVGSTAAPALRLTNQGSAPCQVVDAGLGAVVLDQVSQGGVLVTAQPTTPSLTDDLGTALVARLRTLGPGQSLTVPLSVVPGPDHGYVLQTFAYAPLITLGAWYPIDRARPLSLSLHYTPPALVVTGAPLCVAAPGSGTLHPAASSGVTHVLWYVAGAAAVVVLVLVLLLVLLARRRRRAGTVAAAVLLATGLVVFAWRPIAAHADISVTSAVAGPAGDCLKQYAKPGGDPAGILNRLSQHDVSVTIDLSTENYDYEQRFTKGIIFIHWRPDDKGATYKDGVAQYPCDELYHELYHAFEDADQGVDLHECILPDGTHTGIAIKEVHAAKAENKLRATEPGHAQRTKYGDNIIPPGDCRPPRPDDPMCHPTYGCPPPPKQPAHTTTDPHLRTLDGRYYDFQGVGEFVLVKDPTTDPATALQIQARQQPWPGNRYVSVNTAVAANVNADRVEVDLGPSGPVLLVNSAPAPLSTTTLGHGGKVIVTPVRGHPLIAIDWPDGSYALVYPYGGSLTTEVLLAPGYAGKVAGLLGNDDGQKDNDLPTSDPPSYDTLYPAFADQMRISSAQSLFTYPAGRDTASYTDRSFPDRAPAHLANQDWARTQCQTFGVTDPATLADCTVDLAETGSADLLAGDVAGSVLATGFAPGGTSTQLGIAAPGGIATVSFQGTSGQRIYVEASGSTLPDSCNTLRLNRPDGTTMASGCLIGGEGSIDTVTLPVTGTYTIVVDPPGTATGTVSLRIFTATNEGGALSIDGAPTTLTVGSPGATASASFTGTAGRMVFVDVSNATVPDQCSVLNLLDSTGHQLASGCIIGGAGLIDRTVLPASGSYQIVLDPAGNATGSAQIRLTSATDQQAAIVTGGPPVTAVIGQPGAIATLSFTAKAGDIIYVEASSGTVADQCGVLAIDDPSGKQIAGGCVISHAGSVDRTVLAQAGVYHLVVDPSARGTGSVSLRVLPVTDDTGIISVGGTAVTVHIATPGAIADYQFTGSAGQHVRVDLSGSTLPDACGLVSLLDSAGHLLESACVIGGAGTLASIALPATGSYHVVVDPSAAATGQLIIKAS